VTGNGALGQRCEAKYRRSASLWLDNFRHSHEQQLRKHLNDIKYYARIKRGADALEVACIELLDAALGIVTVGDERAMRGHREWSRSILVARRFSTA